MLPRLFLQVMPSDPAQTASVLTAERRTEDVQNGTEMGEDGRSPSSTCLVLTDAQRFVR